MSRAGSSYRCATTPWSESRHSDGRAWRVLRSRDVTRVRPAGPSVALLGALAVAPSGCARPSLDVVPEGIRFGSVEVGGEPARALLRVTNNGGAALEIERFALEQAGRDFRLHFDRVESVEPKTTHTVAVLYEPEREGESRALITIETNATDGPVRISVEGRGVRLGLEVETGEPQCESDPGSLSFGRVLAGQPSRRSVRLRATGTGAVQIDASIEPASSGVSCSPTECRSSMPEFSIVPSFAALRLEPGAEAEIEASYAPMDAVDDTAVLVLSTDSASAPSFRIPLCGQGLIAAVCHEPENVLFEDLAPGEVAAATVRLESCGNLPVEIRSIEIARDASHPSSPDFDATALGALPVILSPGESMDVRVEIHVTSREPREAYLRVLSNATLSGEEFIRLAANLPPPCALSIVPSPLRFHGPGPSIERRLLIANEGSNACSITGIALASQSSAFAIVSNLTLPYALTPGAHVFVVVAHQPGPVESWPERGSIEIAFESSRAAVTTVALEGNMPLSPGCHFDVIPAALSFGKAPAGATGEETVLLRNVGSALCSIASVRLDAASAPGFFYSPLGGSIGVAPGASVDLPVLFHPLVVGAFRGALLLESTDVDAPLREILLLGEASEPPPPRREEECRVGSMATYHRYDTPFVGSALLDPLSESPFHVTCEEPLCDPEEVQVEVAIGEFRCVAPPPSCGGREGLEYQSNRWACVACDVIVQYGGLFQGLRLCAPMPASCSGSRVATFSERTRSWACAPLCDGGLYDRRVLDDGTVVCIPC